MTIREAYERYKHMDHLLSDREWLSADFNGMVLNDLWQAIKAQIAAEQLAICSRCLWWQAAIPGWGYCQYVEQGQHRARLSAWGDATLDTAEDFGCTEWQEKKE